MSKISSGAGLEKNKFAELYQQEDNYWWSCAKRDLVNRVILKFLPSQNSMKLLDVGCGGGAFLGTFKNQNRLFGLESSRTGVNIASKKTKAKITMGRAECIPFKNSSFQILTSLDVIEHADDLKALKEFYRVLSNQGFAILTAPAFGFLWSPRDILLGHKRRYTKKQIKSILKQAGFEVVKFSYINIFYFPALFIYSVFKKLIFKETLPKSAIMRVHPFINSLLIFILKLEQMLIMYIDAPIGTSILCVAKKNNYV